MVYRGRPSTGCKTCRERKVKCDERPGGCVRCEDRKLSCPGYDRTVDAFFHDETAKVKAKAKARLSKLQPSDLRDSDGDVEELAMVPADVKASPRIHLLAPLVDQGISYFMTNHAIGIDQPSISSQAYNKHLSTNGFHPMVSATMTAIGIAGIANIYADPGLKREATQWYLRAIRMANAAISSPNDVRKDTTLVAINLLTMFEATFNTNDFEGWSNHVDGASLLIKARGRDQIHTAAGRRMYLHTVGLMTINCMGKGVRIPDYVEKINDEIVEHLDIEDPRTAFFFLHLKTANLRAHILNSSKPDLKDIIDQALELDALAAPIFQNAASSEWRYETVPCFDKIPGVFGHYYHVYPTHSTAQTWNWVRYTRIYLHDIIRNCTRFFTNFLRENIDLPQQLLNCDTATERLPLVRVSGGYSSVWALFVAGSMPTASAASQDYVLHCLERVERDFGIKQASVFAKALRYKRSLANSGEMPLSLCPRYLPPDRDEKTPYPEANGNVS
ncbi:hypothetical protein DE146DRAFT_607934 [Phaeosphaeria sp. MPI-PUGE-AT-0046c]|nr:hypothetical protein DE146DRAFT_607934 [Phaeosphaeria sp. MPI-PUGE-AT-0046c]